MTHALAQAGAIGWPKLTTVPVDMAQIPLKRSMLDVVAFRSLDKVRERLFGPAQKPDVKIPGKEKAARLGEPGRLFLHQCVTTFRGQLLPETVAILRQHFGPRVCALAAATLKEQLQAHLPRLEQKRAELQQVRAHLQALAMPLQKLAASTKGLMPKLAELGRAFDHEVAQAPGKQVVLQPQSKPVPRDTRNPTNPAATRRP
jgi:hypothetical protein